MIRVAVVVRSRALRAALERAVSQRASVVVVPLPGGGGGGGGLTEREREVLALLAGGLPNRAIGARLGISQQTVKTYVAAILDKLDAATRAEAVAIGLRRGLIML